MNVVPPLRALLAKSIDYAGLFPPATLQLEPALKNFAAYLQSDESWMLSTFVLPIAKFADAAWFFSEFTDRAPLSVSALGPRTRGAIAFAEEMKNIAKGICEFDAEAKGTARVEQLEIPLPPNTGERELEAVTGLGVRSFWEAPAPAAEGAIASIAEWNRARERPLGFKLRTGGVTAEAFPSSAQIARALLASGKHKVPIKFTAGLHHPVRMFREEVKTKMHGFLNVLGAGVLALEHGWNLEQTVAMLEDEEAAAFGFTGTHFRWREFQIETSAIESHRTFVTSFGSCSFDEPRQDLRAMRLL